MTQRSDIEEKPYQKLVAQEAGEEGANLLQVDVQRSQQNHQDYQKGNCGLSPRTNGGA